MSWRDIVKAKELTPKQKKLDNNHNGVIDAQDFHIMNGAEKKSCGCASCKQKSNNETVRKTPEKTHYTKDGKVWRGKTHKMPNGNLMTEDPHNEKSVRLYHKEELPKRRSAFTAS
jgi:hypothetical protein